MAEASIYERNDAIDANLDPTEGLTGAPPIWAEKCTGLVDKIRRILVNWRKGNSSYVLIPEAVILVEPLNKEDAGATSTDLRHSESGKWGREMAARAWRLALDFAEKNGPIIDAQIVCEGWDEAKGLYRPLKGGVNAKKCPQPHSGTRERDDRSFDTKDRVIDQLLEAIDRRDMRVERMADKITNIAEGIEKVCDVAFRVSERAVVLTNSVTDAARADKKADQDFSLNVIRAHTIAEAIKTSVSEVAPHLKDIFNGFTGAKPGRAYAVIARELIKSFSDSQREKMAEAGLSDLLADFEKVLTKIAESTDADECKALMVAIAPALASNQGVFAPLCTDGQRDLVVELLKLAGLFK